MKKVKTIKTEGMYALLCHCGAGGYWDVLVIGVFCTKEDAKRYNDADDILKKCSARHTVRKCDVKLLIKRK